MLNTLHARIARCQSVMGEIALHNAVGVASGAFMLTTSDRMSNWAKPSLGVPPFEPETVCLKDVQQNLFGLLKDLQMNAIRKLRCSCLHNQLSPNIGCRRFRFRAVGRNLRQTPATQSFQVHRLKMWPERTIEPFVLVDDTVLVGVRKPAGED